MGNGKSKFNEIPLGAPSAPLPQDKCIASAPSTAEETYVVTPSGFNITEMSKTPELMIKNSAGEHLYTSKAAPWMKTGGNESTVSDVQGKVLTVTKFKMGFGSGVTRLLKTKATFDGQESADTPYDDKQTPLYNFAKMESKMAYTNTCKYGIYTAADTVEPIYLGKLVSTMSKLVTVETPDGTIIAKVCPGSGKTFDVQVAAGVDVIAIVSIANALYSNGNGSSAGALAGAGVV